MKYSTVVRHEIRLVEHMALDQFGVDCVFSEQALSVLDDLPQEWLANASKIDQVDGAAGGLRELSDQRHLCFNVQHVPDINRQIDITVGPALANC